MKIEERGRKLVIVDFNELEAYKIAYKIEKDGILFYTKLANKVTKPEIKEILELLIGEENKHLKFFQECINEIREDKEDKFEEDDLLSSIDFGIFKPYQDIEELESALTQVRKAVKLGLIIEEKSIKFYEACRDNLSSFDTRLEIENIIEEEKKHKALFSSMLDK